MIITTIHSRDFIIGWFFCYSLGPDFGECENFHAINSHPLWAYCIVLWKGGSSIYMICLLAIKRVANDNTACLLDSSLCLSPQQPPPASWLPRNGRHICKEYCNLINIRVVFLFLANSILIRHSFLSDVCTSPHRPSAESKMKTSRIAPLLLVAGGYKTRKQKPRGA